MTDKEENTDDYPTTEPPAAPAVRVDWMWTVSVERVLADAPDLFGWAN